jgi:hypothetical protein
VTATTLSAGVAVTDGSISVTSAADFPEPPFRVVVNQEEMVVYQVSGTTFSVHRGQTGVLGVFAEDTFEREVPAGGEWEWADDGISRWRGSESIADVDFSVTGGEGIIEVVTTGVSATPALVMAQPLLDLQVRQIARLIDTLDTTHDNYVRGGTDLSVNSYRARLTVDGAGAMSLRLSKNVTSVNTALAAAVVPPGTVAVGDEINVAFQATDSGTTSLAAKAWRTVDGEPAAWQTTATDTEAILQTANHSGLRFRPTATGTVGIVHYTVAQVPVGITHASSDPVLLIDPWPIPIGVEFGIGPPLSNPPTGAEYIDIGASPPVVYFRVGFAWYSVTLV